MIQEIPESVRLAVQLAGSYVQGRACDASSLVDLVRNIHMAVVGLSAPTLAVEASVTAERPKPAVSIRSSVQNDFIICLHDGKKFKSLKRHLMSEFGQTPEQYREAFGLPHDYPMTAPAYAAQRSALAKSNGLGQQRRKAA